MNSGGNIKNTAGAAYGSTVESVMRQSADPFLLFHIPPQANQHQKYADNSGKHQQYSTPSNSAAPQEEFFFKKRRDPINWRLLSSINVDRLIREADVGALQQLLGNITFCDIEAEDLRNVDANFVKLFQLAQLTIEYLLHSQDRLTGNKRQLQDALVSEGERESQLLKQVQTLESQLTQMAKENRQLKKTVYAYQLWSKVPGGLTNQQPVVSAYHRCRFCPKVFNSEFYLEGHLQRRHPDKPNYLAEFPMIPPAQFPVPSSNDSDQVMLITKITETVERFSNRLIETERSLRQEMEAKLQSQLSARNQNSVADEKQQQERLSYQRELQDLKTMMARQLEEEKIMLREERKALEEMRLAQMKPASNLGRLEDDNDVDEKAMFKKLEERYESAFNNLQLMLQKELNNLKSNLYDKESAAKRASQLEETLRYQQSLLKQPPVSSPSKKSKPDLWPEYFAMMQSFKYQPIKSFPMKSAYMHTANQLLAKRREVEHELNMGLERCGVCIEAVQSPEKNERLAQLLKRETAALAARNPYHLRMRAYMQDTLDSIINQTFRMKPLRPMFRIKTLETIPLSDKNDFFNSGTMALSFNPLSPTNHLRHKSSNRSLNSDVVWDQSYQSDYDDDDDNQEDEGDYSEISYAQSSPSTGPTSSPVKIDENTRRDVFSKAFSLFKSNRSSKSAVQTPLELDPSLQQAVGHVPDTKSKKQPLESRKYSMEQQQQQDQKDAEDFDISDISESIDSLEIAIPDEIRPGTLDRSQKQESSILDPLKQQNPAADLRDMTTPDISEVLREIKSTTTTGSQPSADPNKPAAISGLTGRKPSWTDDLDDELNAELQKF